MSSTYNPIDHLNGPGYAYLGDDSCQRPQSSTLKTENWKWPKQKHHDRIQLPNPRCADRQNIQLSPGVIVRSNSPNSSARKPSLSPRSTPSRAIASRTPICSPALAAWARPPAVRILAKALNCVKGPTATPCDPVRALPEHRERRGHGRPRNRRRQQSRHRRDRELRQNVAGSRRASRFKIYIIDEVHMLTHAGLQRPPEDAGGTAAARQIHLRHDRSAEDPGHDPVALPALRFRRHWKPKIVEPLEASGQSRGNGGGRRGTADRRPQGGWLDARCPIASGPIAGFRRRALRPPNDCTRCSGPPPSDRIIALVDAIVAKDARTAFHLARRAMRKKDCSSASCSIS